MARRVVHVLLPRGNREEADAARRVLGMDVTVIPGMAAAHVPSQVLRGDVIVVGNRKPEINATGSVEEYQDLPAMVAAYEGNPPEPEPPPGEPEPELAGEPEQPDPTDGMERIEMIQHAAARWPGEESWATMKTDALRAAIRDREAGD